MLQRLFLVPRPVPTVVFVWRRLEHAQFQWYMIFYEGGFVRARPDAPMLVRYHA